MKNTILPAVLFFMVLSFVLLGKGSHNSDSLSHEKENGGEKENTFIIARTDIFGRLERPGVFFNHGLHTRTYKAEGCRTCHKRNEEGRLFFSGIVTISNKNKDMIRDAYHDKCIGCHRKHLQESNKSGPIKCGNCHRKKFNKLNSEYPHSVFDFYLHDKHNKRLHNDCSFCHHIYDPDEEDENLRLVYEKSAEESCYYCHDLTVKRGPELAGIVQVSKQKKLSMQNVAHYQCVNCHLWYEERREKAGPVECVNCHTGKYRTIAQLENVPRPDRDQPKKSFISIEDGKMKGVSFDHTFHEKNSKTCRSCHHETLQACRKCHGLTGSPDGGWINLANAYHDPSTGLGCTGCHKEKKTEKNCAGCHYHLVDMDIQAKGPKKEICTVCHSGKKDGSAPIQSISLSELDTMKVPEKVTIKILEKQYEPSTFPHLKIIRKLIGVSNESKMGTSFHRNIQTICSGCHHQSIAEAEVKKDEPPYCRNCHSITFDAKNINRPRLLAVYHRQCMGCHARMEIKEMGCTDCHKQKAIHTKDLLSDIGGITTLYKGDA
jgi:hypothetical protein